MKFIMIDKGYEYDSDNGKYNLQLRWQKECVLKTAFNCRNRYADVRHWIVKIKGKNNQLWDFRSLRAAKDWCIEHEREEIC